ncbi:MAG: hypothetical protein HRT77_08440 [Halioglobus sp.]|nr:hypothetical protein [Halioglobus sp.]
MYTDNTPHRLLRYCFSLMVCISGVWGCSDSNDNSTGTAFATPLAEYHDPGTEPWETVPRESLIDTCGLDPILLDEIDTEATHSYAIVRYGKLCHEFYHPDDPLPDEAVNNFSATKTLAAATVGRAVWMSMDLPKPLRDTDRMDTWIDDISFNPNALVGHVLAMIGFNDSLVFGQREFAYDANGNREINRLSDVVEAVIAQDSTYFGGANTTGEFAANEVFTRLGMDNSVWDGKSFGSGWHSDLRDMARLGLWLLHDGVWNQKRLLSSDWVYKITHPSFEDSNTGYGYLTWVAAERNYVLPAIDAKFLQPLGSCDPPALWREYPHGLSESTDCNYDGAASCLQPEDVGVFLAAGAGGQLIAGHRALELVIVTRNAGATAFLNAPWDLIRRALVAHDPVYKGDEAAFCQAYRAGEYAPDLIKKPMQ